MTPKRTTSKNPVREITKTITVPVTTHEEVPIRYWLFRMERNYHQRIESWWNKAEFGMTTLEDDRGRLWVQFSHEANGAEQVLRVNDVRGGSLSMTWSIFERAARRMLDGADEVTFLGNGRFHRNPNDTHIYYTTACHIEYRLTRATLEGLLA